MEAEAAEGSFLLPSFLSSLLFMLAMEAGSLEDTGDREVTEEGELASKTETKHQRRSWRQAGWLTLLRSQLKACK